MPKHILGPMSASDFRRDAKLKKFRFVNKMNSKHPLKQIYDLLLDYERTQKFFLKRRHQLLTDITAICLAYAGTKPLKKWNSGKLQTVFRLGNQCTLRVLLEQRRAQDLALRLNRPTGGRGVNVGVKKEHELRFERVAKGGQNVARGDDLLDLARAYGAPLTGDDTNDYYAMKKLLKVVRTEDANKLNLVYMSQDQRDNYRLSFDEDQNLILDHTGAPKSTAGPYGLDFAMYSASLDGTIYAELITTMRGQFPKIKKSSMKFHHSSFLAGETALCAGTIKIDRGRLIEINNESGHYTPGLQDLVNVCEAILDTGYRPLDDGYALFYDFDGKAFPQIPQAILRIPLGLFVADKGRPFKPEDFSVDIVHSDCFYVDPVAARNRGCREHKPKTGSLMAKFA
jgi:hypothetical protein